MSVDHGGMFSDEGPSLKTDYMMKVPPDEAPVQPQHQPKDESDLVNPLQNQPFENKLVASDEEVRGLPTKMQLVPKTEFDDSRRETKATTIFTISTNNFLEIKAQRQSVLNRSFDNGKVPSPTGGNLEFCPDKFTQVFDEAKGNSFRTDGNANKELLEFGKNHILDSKTQTICNIVDKKLNVGIDLGLTRDSSLGQFEQVEVLDLSLPKMKDRDKMRQCAWIADPEYDEGSLHMEVDEIVDEPQHVEVEQEDEDCLSPSEREVPVYLQHNWNLPCPSSPEAIRTSTYSSSPISYATDTLLIDDLGIPYTLTADGLKVPQIEDALDADGLFEQTGLNLNKVEDNPSLFANVANITDSKLQTQLSSLCPNFSLDHASVEATQVSPNLETNPSDSSNTLANAHASDLPSVPIHVMSNTKGSNTPILFLPPSQLRPLSSPISKVNPELITLSLQGHTQSTTMFLVVSTPQASSPEKAHQRSTSSTAAPALATCPLDVGSTSNSSTVSSDSATVSSGLTIPTSPTSSTASSSTSTVTSSPAKQLHNDTCPDLPVPTSFREALFRLSVSVEKNQEPENPLAITTSMPDSSTSAHEHKNHKTEESCDGDQNHLVDTTSSLHPGSPIIPSSTPNNQEPRRILYCQYCPRVFYYVSDLERHSITHSQSKPHVCHICGKAFKRSSHLERHKHIHTGQRNFVCQLCPRRFRESGELMRHQRVHTGEKPYQCLICHMRFAERNTLRRHTKRKHQGQQLEALDMKVLSEGGSDSLVGVQGVSEENEEWYSSTLPQRESDSDTGGEGTS